MPPTHYIWRSLQKSCKFGHKSPVVGICFLKRRGKPPVRYIHLLVGSILTMLQLKEAGSDAYNSMFLTKIVIILRWHVRCLRCFLL